MTIEAADLTQILHEYKQIREHVAHLKRKIGSYGPAARALPELARVQDARVLEEVDRGLTSLRDIEQVLLSLQTALKRKRELEAQLEDLGIGDLIRD